MVAGCSRGEHELTPNIVHLVLARLPDAPEGVKGISLFVVPKFLVHGDGSLGARNDVECVSLEHKLGIHASPTAVLAFGEHGGAVGCLVGEPNRGLEYMFTMMNHARLAVGLEGVAISERAYQQARDYARERVQANDLLGRKTVREEGVTLLALVEEMRADARELGSTSGEDLWSLAGALDHSIQLLEQSAHYLIATAGHLPRHAYASAVPYLMLFGTVCGAWQMARAALVAQRHIEAGADPEFYRAKIATARFYAGHVLPRALVYAHVVRHGGETTLALEESAF